MYFCFVLLSLSRSPCPTSKNASTSFFSSRKQTKTCSTFLLSFPQLISRSKHLHLCCCSLGCCYRLKPNDTQTHAQLHMQLLLSKIKLKTHHQHYAVRRRSFEAKTRSLRSFLFFSLSLFLLCLGCTLRQQLIRARCNNKTPTNDERETGFCAIFGFPPFYRLFLWSSGRRTHKHTRTKRCTICAFV